MPIPRSHLLAAACLLIFVSAEAAGAEEPYEEIRVLLPSETAAKGLIRTDGLELMGLGDGDLRLLSRPSLTDALIAEGWAVEILRTDLEAFYASRLAPADAHGPWVNYDETVAELDLLHEEFPEITSAPFSLGLSHQERDIWAIKISDHPDLDEEEPEVLFDGLHHAREIMSVELVLFYARYLCENYGTDSLVTQLVENREVFFVPIVNPDGFAYNEFLSPSGGGMWRKNRRVNEGTGCLGVDNNRNYPFRWGGAGSSDEPCDNTYRGPEPASEPENRAMIAFINSREFVTHNSIHSVVGTVLMPWCDRTEPTPDDALFRTLAGGMTSRSGYSFGQCPEILYLVSGGSIDWAYGEQESKPKIFSFSTEVGGTGFWPDISEREGLLQENLHSMLYLTQAAGAILGVGDIEAAAQDGTEQIRPGDTVEMTVEARNSGLIAGAKDVSLRLRCDDPYVVLLEASAEIGPLAAGEAFVNTSSPFRFVVEEECLPGRRIPFTVELLSGAASAGKFPFVLPIGHVDAIYANEFEQQGEEWFVDESHTASSGAFVRVIPNGTPYQPAADATQLNGVYAWITGQNTDEANDDVDMGIAATRSPDFDLSGYGDVWLTMSYFHGQRDGGDDPSGDFFSIDVSSDGGGSWVNLVWIGDQASAPVWRELSVDLSDFIPFTDRVRFRVQVSDGPTDGDVIEGGIDGFILADIGRPSELPGTPSILRPPDGATDVSAWPTLAVGNANDPDGDPLTYGFRIYSDIDATMSAGAADGVVEGSATTSWTVPLPLDIGTYYWRAYAADRDQRGYYTPLVSFTVTDSSSLDYDLATARLAVGPNPAKEQIRIRCLIPPSTVHRLAVYDPTGRLVRDLAVPGSGPGWHEAIWDGRNNAGRLVARGSYWIRLWTPAETRTVRVVRVD